MKKWVIYLLLISCVLSACRPSLVPEAQSDSHTPVDSYELSVSLTASETNEPNANYPFDPTQPFIQIKTHLKIDSTRAQPDKYVVLALADYKQVETTLDGFDEGTQLFHWLDIGPAKPIANDVTIHIPNQAGKHKIYVVVFRAADKHLLDRDFRLFSPYLASASALDIQIGAADTWPATPHSNLPTRISRATAKEFTGILVNHTTDDTTTWVSETVKAGQTLSVSIHLGNDAGPDSKFVIVGFLDWNQIAISEIHPSYFGTVERERRLQIDTKLIAPQAQGIHELQFLYFAEPFITEPEKIATSTSISESDAASGIALPMDTLNSVRTALIVNAE